MVKLKNIVKGLDSEIYEAIESSLLKSKAENFLFLFKAYREDSLKDVEIIESLNINSNSFYVLKSRLIDKIQEFLAGDIYADMETVTTKLHQIPEICINSSREVARMYLQKLEQDLLKFDMHNELMIVYSALKKVNSYSDKYFHYSQLYNKNIAFCLSLEKSTEILADFNRVLGQYLFSRSHKLLETLNFLRSSIEEHYVLNNSRQIELIKNIFELQFDIFINMKSESNSSTEEILQQTQKILNELPESAPFKSWGIAIDYLSFEYYNKIGHSTLTLKYFEKVNANLSTLLLTTHVCLSSNFLISKIAYLQKTSKLNEFNVDSTVLILSDSADFHSIVLLGIYQAMSMYYEGRLKEACLKLNELLNINSFKDYFHINTEIKLSLAFIYLKLEEFDLADNILKNTYRKIKGDKLENYYGILDLIKVFGENIKRQSLGKPNVKQVNHFTLFKARNTGKHAMLKHLIYELDENYT